MFLIILGSYPPPRGGVSTHIERLLPYLKKKDVNYVVWDHSTHYKEHPNLICIRKTPFKAFKTLWRRNKVLHCPLTNISLGRVLFLLLLRMVGVKLILTFVASTELTLGGKNRNLSLLLIVARLSSHLIVLNSSFKNFLLEHEVREEKISMIPAFIPVQDEVLLKQVVPREVIRFCEATTPTLISYARPVSYKDQELYGVDLLIEMALKMRDLHPRLGVLIVIPEIQNVEYLDKIRSVISNNNLESCFYFAIGVPISFVALLRHADIFIRATNTDGDALTVREALYYNVPTIASDVSPRPDGTFLFQNRNSDDLHRVVCEVVSIEKTPTTNGSVCQGNNAERYIDVFNKVAGIKELSNGN